MSEWECTGEGGSSTAGRGRESAAFEVLPGWAGAWAERGMAVCLLTCTGTSHIAGPRFSLQSHSVGSAQHCCGRGGAVGGGTAKRGRAGALGIDLMDMPLKEDRITGDQDNSGRTG